MNSKFIIFTIVDTIILQLFNLLFHHFYCTVVFDNKDYKLDSLECKMLELLKGKEKLEGFLSNKMMIIITIIVYKLLSSF